MSAILEFNDIKLIKNITSILGPKLALKICNQTTDIEKAGGIVNPKMPSKHLSKFDCFLFLIEHDLNISDNKKSLIVNQKNNANSDEASSSSAVPSVNSNKLKKKNRKKLKSKVNNIQGELDRLCLNQIKNEIKNPKNSNYFAIKLNKLDGQSTSEKSKDNLIKPSTFNLKMSGGVPSLEPNYCNALITRPTLDLKQINFNSPTNNSFQSGVLQSSNSQFGNLQNNSSQFGNLHSNSSQFGNSESSSPFKSSFGDGNGHHTTIINNVVHVHERKKYVRNINLHISLPIKMATRPNVINVNNVRNETNFNTTNVRNEANFNTTNVLHPMNSIGDNSTAIPSTSSSANNSVASLFRFGSN